MSRETLSAVWKIEELLEIIKQEVEAREGSYSMKINEEWISQGTNTDTRNLQQQIHWCQRKILQSNHIKSNVFNATNCTTLHCVRSQLRMIEEVHLLNRNVVLNV